MSEPGKIARNRKQPSLEAGHWLEVKIIKGKPYQYECWRENGRKKSRYIGRIKKATQ